MSKCAIDIQETADMNGEAIEAIPLSSGGVVVAELAGVASVVTDSVITLKGASCAVTPPYPNLANAGAVTINSNNLVLNFSAQGLQIEGAASGTTIDYVAKSEGSLICFGGLLVVNEGISTAIRSTSGLTHSISITTQQDASLNHGGKTFGEGLCTLEVDGTMHLAGESAASASAAAASSADLD